MVKIKHPTSGESDRLLCYAIYTGRGVAPEVNLREGISRTPLQSLNKAAHSGFETQRRHHQKSETGVSVPPKIFLDTSRVTHFTNHFRKSRSRTSAQLKLVIYY